MPIALINALLVDIDPIRVETGGLRIDQGRIIERGANLRGHPDDEVVDCGGAVVMPGLVNGHTHLYSALAVGMPPPLKPPRSFLEILKSVWWRLDQALDAESIEVSARIGALDALRAGTTTLIDHHASPNHIPGSLDLIEQALADVGLRGILCYETTDRHGRAGRDQGLDENRRYLERHAYHRSTQFAGLVGAHASFTLEDETLDQLVHLADQFHTGVHIHVAEDLCDEDLCNEQHQVPLIDRLAGHGLLYERAVFAHGTHLDPDAIARVSKAGLTLAHNPRSNMNNAVGYAPVARFGGAVMLGTDGIGADMFAEAKHAWFISRDAEEGLTPANVVAMLAAASRRASDSLDITLGRLAVGAGADVVITDYLPATPLNAENFPAHFIFAMGSHNVKDVIVAGRWVVRDRRILGVDERQIRCKAIHAAGNLWQRMAALV